MANFSRSAWATILFIALFAPVALYVLYMLAPLGSGGAGRTGSGAPSTATATMFSTTDASPASAPAPSERVGGLMAAGDGRTLWLVRPLMLIYQDRKIPAYELLQRASNNGVWTALQLSDSGYFSGFPRGFAVVPSSVAASAGGKSGATAYVLTDNAMQSFTAEETRLEDRLPPGHTLLAVTGASDGVFALTAGPAHASTTRPGDRLVTTVATQPTSRLLTAPASTLPTTAPATQTATTKQASATRPAETALAITHPTLANAYWFTGGHWTMLPPLGEMTANSHDVPSYAAQVELVRQGSRLMALWVNPSESRTLVARSLELSAHPANWSAPVMSELPTRVTPPNRLMALTLDKSAYVLWTAPLGTALVLHGGRLVTEAGSPADLTLPKARLLSPMPLGVEISPTVMPGIAVGAAENSLVVLVDKGESLTAAVFNNRGQSVTPPTSVKIIPFRNQGQITENIGIALLIVIAALAIWQWQQRPETLEVPTGMVLAPLHLRAVGCVIDIAVALVLTAIIFNQWDPATWGVIFDAWTGAFDKPEDLLNWREIPVFVGIYLGHITVGELFFRRSLGKVILGTQVLMRDGKSPTVAAVALRNLMRLPEMIPGVLSLYILIAAERQRVGDLFAGTVVVAPQKTQVPPDPDAGTTPDAESGGKEG